MYAMRPLRNFKTNQCCHLISRIANRAFFLNDEEKMHEKSIHLVLKELEDERLAGRAKKGLSVDDEKQQKARRRDVSRFEQDMPDRVPHLLEKGSDKVAYDILKQLVDGPRRPAELRAALGIASANFFTARYLTPLAKSGYIAVATCHSPSRCTSVSRGLRGRSFRGVPSESPR